MRRYAYDVDGDGDNDVITSLACCTSSGWLGTNRSRMRGRSPSSSTTRGGGDRPEQNKYGVVFSELHSVDLFDIDGDGSKRSSSYDGTLIAELDRVGVLGDWRRGFSDQRTRNKTARRSRPRRTAWVAFVISRADRRSVAPS